MKKFFNTFLTVFAIVFAIPSFLILISWNSLPGEFLYPLKTSLEDVALAITVRTPIASAFSINFTQRRFSEANRLLAKNGSTLGYSLLVTEASESKEIILGQNDTTKAQELSDKIEEYKKNIEEKKLALQTQPQAILPSPKPTGVATPTPAVVTPEPVDEIVQDLEDTQQELEDIQDELEEQIKSHPQGAQEENGGKKEEKDNKGNDRRQEEPSPERPQKD